MNQRTIEKVFIDYGNSLPEKANDAAVEEGLRRYKSLARFVLSDPQLHQALNYYIETEVKGHTPLEMSSGKLPIISCIQQDDGKILTMLSLKEDWNIPHFGLLICDVVRHVANAFKAPEKMVWYWVEKERYHQTSPATEIGRSDPNDKQN